MIKYKQKIKRVKKKTNKSLSLLEDPEKLENLLRDIDALINKSAEELNNILDIEKNS